MEENSHSLRLDHVMISSSAMRRTDEFKKVLSKNRHQITLKWHGKYISVFAKGQFVICLEEDEWMPVHHA